MEWGSVAEWFGAIATAGAVIVSLWLARKGDRDAAAREVRVKRASAQKTLMKLLVIINSLDSMDRYFRNTQAAATPKQRGGERWRYTQPIVGLTAQGETSFDGDEHSVFLDAGEIQFSMDLSLLAQRHSAAVEMLKEYGRARQAFLDLLPPPVDSRGTEGGVILTSRQEAALRPKAAALEAMLSDMVRHTGNDLKLGLSVGDRIGPICKRYFGDPKFPSLKRPETGQMAAFATNDVAPPSS